MIAAVFVVLVGIVVVVVVVVVAKVVVVRLTVALAHAEDAGFGRSSQISEQHQVVVVRRFRV